ncbi:unnamed protein product [Notodromas monacha]|uniref:Uncharacterized protein n=1 Tax=Notodromas monacha TaxID=399045 RepID=A0A7R9GIV5_9CRUS|nr:unnamed protein product [Notodromas monacha]CAG0923002.1 unnamed protein product [Notodromas monacha]
MTGTPSFFGSSSTFSSSSGSSSNNNNSFKLSGSSRSLHVRGDANQNLFPTTAKSRGRSFLFRPGSSATLPPGSSLAGMTSASTLSTSTTTAAAGGVTHMPNPEKFGIVADALVSGLGACVSFAEGEIARLREALDDANKDVETPGGGTHEVIKGKGTDNTYLILSVFVVVMRHAKVALNCKLASAVHPGSESRDNE